MAPKRKAIPEDASAQDSSPTSPKSTSKAKKSKAQKTVPETEASGWVLEYPNLLLSKTYGKPEARSKIAAFDLDGTLVGTKKDVGKSAPEADNWRFANKKVKKVVKEFVADKYTVVIFTNQGYIQGALDGKAATKVKERIDNILKELDVPAHVFAATAPSKAEDSFRKPAPGMWTFFKAKCSAGQAIVLEDSFFVGDAAGRDKDFADSDKQFAEHVGLPFKTPEEVFGVLDIKKEVPTVEGGENHNFDLESALRALAAKREAEGGNAIYAARALQKVADVVKNWPAKIQSSKDVADVKGVGKSSKSLIDEFLKDGKLAALDPPEDGDSHAKAAAVKPSAATAMALKFA